MGEYVGRRAAEMRSERSEWRATLRGPDGRRVVMVLAHTIREAQRDARLAAVEPTVARARALGVDREGLAGLQLGEPGIERVLRRLTGAALDVNGGDWVAP